MSYFDTIKTSLKNHITFLELIEVDENQNQKVDNHLKISLEIDKLLSAETPEKLKEFIEYLSQEGRNFGWSFPLNKSEDECENSFLNLKNQMKRMIGGMTVNERLYYFGYLDEFEKLPSKHKTARDNILEKLFITVESN